MESISKRDAINYGSKVNGKLFSVALGRNNVGKRLLTWRLERRRWPHRGRRCVLVLRYARIVKAEFVVRLLARRRANLRQRRAHAEHGLDLAQDALRLHRRQHAITCGTLRRD